MAKGFLFFDDWEKPFRKLSGDEFKALFWAMFDFQKNGTEPPEFNGASSLIADFVFPQLDRRLQKQKEGRENAEKRWGKEDTQSTNSDRIGTHKQSNTNLIHKDKTEDKDKTSVTPAHARSDTQTRSKFVKPTIDEIRAYCEERKNSVDAERFFDFYESKGWMIGQNRMRDWKAAVRTWEKSANNSQKHGEETSNPFLAMLHDMEAQREQDKPLYADFTEVSG